MAITQKDVKLLWGRSASRCAICRIELSQSNTSDSSRFPTGEQAHIVAEEITGPRGKSVLDATERNTYHNLILLCPTCHVIIDKDEKGFPVERLYSIKSRHELWVQETLSRKNIKENRDLISLSDCLLSIELLKPLFAWLHKPVPSDEAQKFFEISQRFWYVGNISVENIDHVLTAAVDRILRPLAGGENTCFRDKLYASSKLSGAYSRLKNYFSGRGIGFTELDRDEEIFNIIAELTVHCEMLLRHEEVLDEYEIRVLKYILSLMSYYEELFVEGKYAIVPEIILKQHLLIVERFLVDQLGLYFPDALDGESLYKIRQLSKGAFVKNPFSDK